MVAQDWSQAVAAVLDAEGIVRGTAFFVGPDVALTCHHVLEAAKGSPTLRLVGSDVGEAIIGVDSDAQLDLTLVRVPARVDRPWLTLSLRPEMIGRAISSLGFPRDRPVGQYPKGFPLDPSIVTGPAAVNWRGQLVDTLVLAGADVAPGMSGAPAVDVQSGDVVGILRFSEKEGSHAFAVPAQAAVSRWPSLPLDRDQVRSFVDLVETIPEALAATAWTEFDPGAMHCVVLGSEAQSGERTDRSLDSLFRELLTDPSVTSVWESFLGSSEGRRLVRSGNARPLSGDYARSNVRVASFSVLDAYASPASFDLATRLLVEADLALFDVTGFEPGVMLLLGARAATRRGVTINSHGGGWKEGEPLDRPFNLADLSLASHSSVSSYVGDDPRLARLSARLTTGFEQLSRQPHYQDLPVYEALRRLGPQEDASGSIPIEEQVLVLCSYHEKHFGTWEGLRNQLRQALGNRGIRTKVERLLDVATPQLVSQSLYERIRRCAGCVADWSGSSPSTFFELGVRLAVSPWSVVQIAGQGWYDTATSEKAETKSQSVQLRLMKTLFNPLTYLTADPELGERIARELVELRGQTAGSAGHRLREVAAEALSGTEESVVDVVQQLKGEADAFNHENRVRNNVPQALFYEVASLKADQERAALERRIAAWLYLEHRVRAGQRADADPSKQEWRALGDSVAADLFLSTAEADVELAFAVGERVQAHDVRRTVILYRRKGDALSRSGHKIAADEAYGMALAQVDELLDSLSGGRMSSENPFVAVEQAVASDAAELLGERGGLLRRQEDLPEALESYRRGADLERRHELNSTYNRGNAIKFALLVGDRTVSKLHDDLSSLRKALSLRLETDERASDDAWLWADLGDVCLLLGDMDGARSSYKAFAKKARTDSPQSTVAILNELAQALQTHGDPAAERIVEAVREIEAMLARGDTAGTA